MMIRIRKMLDQTEITYEIFLHRRGIGDTGYQDHPVRFVRGKTTDGQNIAVADPREEYRFLVVTPDRTLYGDHLVVRNIGWAFCYDDHIRAGSSCLRLAQLPGRQKIVFHE